MSSTSSVRSSSGSVMFTTFLTWPLARPPRRYDSLSDRPFWAAGFGVYGRRFATGASSTDSPICDSSNPVAITVTRTF